MKKINRFIKFVLTCVIIFYNSTVFADLPEELRREVIAFIRVGYLDFPEQQTSALPLSGITINTPLLSDAFNRYGVQSVQRGFPDFTDSDTVRTSITGYQYTIRQFSRIFRLQLSSENLVDSLVRVLSEMHDVIAYAEKNSDAELAQVIPNDQYFDYQWHLYNNGSLGGTPGSDIKAAYGWLIFKGNPDVKVGILDNGVYLSHPDLDQRLEQVQSDTYSEHDGVCAYSHATHVAGLIGAESDNGSGVSGVDWRCKLVSKKILNGQAGWLGDINAAQKVLDLVNNGVQILNHSYVLEYEWFSVTLQLAFVCAYKNNCLSIAAIGNSGGPTNRFPADFQHMVVGVGATNWNDERAGYSSYGPHIKVVAPGGFGTANCTNYEYNYIMSTWIAPPYYYRIQGTSMAAPLVSGLASLVKGKKMSFSNDDVQNIVCLSSDDLAHSGWDDRTGYGRINSRRALEWASPPFKTFYFTTSGSGSSSYCDALMRTFLPFSIPGLVDGYPYWCDRFIV